MEPPTEPPASLLSHPRGYLAFKAWKRLCVGSKALTWLHPWSVSPVGFWWAWFHPPPPDLQGTGAAWPTRPLTPKEAPAHPRRPPLLRTSFCEELLSVQMFRKGRTP